jgi:IclR family transcriptional regulator, acetate operon repressor
LGTLESRGLVDQNTSRGRYQLGYGVVQLAGGATRRTGPVSGLPPDLPRSRRHRGETVNIAINDGTTVVSIDQALRLCRAASFPR